MVLWDSGRLAVLIATAYPLKPHGTAAPVSLSKGNVGPPQKGCVADGCLWAEPSSYLTAYLDPGGAAQGDPQWLARLLARRTVAG